MCFGLESLTPHSSTFVHTQNTKNGWFWCFSPVFFLGFSGLFGVVHLLIPVSFRVPIFPLGLEGMPKYGKLTGFSQTLLWVSVGCLGFPVLHFFPCFYLFWSTLPATLLLVCGGLSEVLPPLKKVVFHPSDGGFLLCYSSEEPRRFLDEVFCVFFVPFWVTPPTPLNPRIVFVSFDSFWVPGPPLLPEFRSDRPNGRSVPGLDSSTNPLVSFLFFPLSSSLLPSSLSSVVSLATGVLLRSDPFSFRSSFQLGGWRWVRGSSSRSSSPVPPGSGPNRWSKNALFWGFQSDPFCHFFGLFDRPSLPVCSSSEHVLTLGCSVGCGVLGFTVVRFVEVFVTSFCCPGFPFFPPFPFFSPFPGFSWPEHPQSSGFFLLDPLLLEKVDSHPFESVVLSRLVLSGLWLGLNSLFLTFLTPLGHPSHPFLVVGVELVSFGRLWTPGLRRWQKLRSGCPNGGFIFKTTYRISIPTLFRFFSHFFFFPLFTPPSGVLAVFPCLQVPGLFLLKVVCTLDGGGGVGVISGLSFSPVPLVVNLILSTSLNSLFPPLFDPFVSFDLHGDVPLGPVLLHVSPVFVRGRGPLHGWSLGCYWSFWGPLRPGKVFFHYSPEVLDLIWANRDDPFYDCSTGTHSFLTLLLLTFADTQGSLRLVYSLNSNPLG